MRGFQLPTYVCFIFGVDFAIQIKVYRKILFYDLSKYTHWRIYSQFICVINICAWSWGIRLNTLVLRVCLTLYRFRNAQRKW